MIWSDIEVGLRFLHLGGGGGGGWLSEENEDSGQSH